jgi:hypothetical protein
MPRPGDGDNVIEFGDFWSPAQFVEGLGGFSKVGIFWPATFSQDAITCRTA